MPHACWNRFPGNRLILFTTFSTLIFPPQIVMISFFQFLVLLGPSGCGKSTARVPAVEALGAETLLVMEIEAVEEIIRARLARDCAARLGNEISINADVNRVHLFDPKSSRSIPCR